MASNWLLKGTPRTVQLEALRRSYEGYALHEHQDDDNVVPRRMLDAEGYGRTGPSRGYAHFLQQRLGKTPMALNEYALFRRDHDFRWAIILSPNSFKDEWVAEGDRWGLDVPLHAFRSDDRSGAERFVSKNARFGGGIVVNFQALLSKQTLAFLEPLIDSRSIYIVDESINIKNPQATTTKTALQLGRGAGARRVLTGKPVTQGPHDLWAQLRAIGALNGFNFYAFRNTFCRMGGFQGKQVLGVKPDKVEWLQDLMAPWAFQARRQEWMRTPGVDYASRALEMTKEQQAHYNRMEAEFITMVGTEDDPIYVPADQCITKMLKLQQIASGFIIDETGTAHDIMPPKSNPMVNEIKGMLTDEIEGKTIIFAHYRHTIKLLAEALREFNPAYIMGQQSDVQEQKARFNADPSCRVLIAQEKAAKYGHTLVGTPADPCLTTIYAENSYSLDDRSQTEERNQGATQVGTVAIWDFIPAPIARQAIEALRHKEDVSAAVMGYARHTGILPHAA